MENDFINQLADDEAFEDLQKIIDSIMEIPDESLDDTTKEVISGMLKGAFTENIKRETVKELLKMFENNNFSRQEAIQGINLGKEQIANYINGLNIRPSCFECCFKGYEGHVSDITIGDAWGNPENDVEYNDDRGLSSLVINTKKGLDFFDKAKCFLKYKEYDLNSLLEGNPAYFECHQKANKRELFIQDAKRNKNGKYLYKYKQKPRWRIINFFKAKLKREKQ